jgi:hypothetical protein
VHTSLKVSSYVIIRDHCPMRFRVTGTDDIEFSLGGRYDPFEFVFNADALRSFLQLGSDALREMAALTAISEDEMSVGQA